MKKLVALLFFLGFGVMLGQVGVGTTIPNNSAQLDVTATNKGMLIPRVALKNSSDITTIINGNVESLIVYNTATIADIVSGFYYWTGTKWQRIISEGDTNFLEASLGFSTGVGPPTVTTPIDPQAGNIYIDESNGDVFTFNGSIWIPQSGISIDSNNALINGSDGLAYLDQSLLGSISVISSGAGAPTLTNPVNPNAGDIYVDETTGDIYSYDGTIWVDNSATSSTSTGTGPPTPTNPINPNAGDIYVDGVTGDLYTYDGTNWIDNSTTSTGSGSPSPTNPTNPNAGDIYVDEITGDIYTYDGTNWIDNSTTSTGTGPPTPTNPANPNTGDIYIDNSTGIIHTYDGTTWVLPSVVSIDPNNIIMVGTDGLAYLNQTTLQANETITTFNQDNTTGITTYISEDGTTTTSNTTSLDPSNILSTGPDGGSFINQTTLQASETITTFNQDNTTGITTYMSEDGTTSTSNTTSLDPSNILSTGPDGGAFINQATIKLNESVTTFVQDNTTGITTYLSENGTITAADITSNDPGNLLINGADGGSYLDPNAIKNNETVTSYVQNNTTGIISYTSEDNSITTSNTTSNNAGNLLITGTDGGSFINKAVIKANETVTLLSQDDNTGIITYTSENGTVANTDVISTNTDNLISSGTDGGSFINQATIRANESVTSFNQDNTTGITTHISEDGTVSAAKITSTDPGNVLSTGTDGGSFIKQADIKANETATTHIQNNSTGIITYTSENGVIYNSNVTSTQLNNLLTTGSDGGSFIDKPALKKPWFGTDDNTSATLNTEDMYAMGNIGIGTNSPIAPLHVVTTGINYSGIFDSQQGSGEATIARFRNTSAVAIDNKAYIGFFNGSGGAAWGIGSRRIGTGGPTDEEFVINNSTGGLYIERVRIKSNGFVGLNISNPTERLHVNGNILATGTITPDYVFEKYFDGVSLLNPTYNMLSLEEIETFTKKYKHLPGVPSANDIKEKGGVLVNRAVEINLEKVEELFLHTIEQQKLLKKQQSLLEAKSLEIDNLKTRMAILEAAFKIKQD